MKYVIGVYRKLSAPVKASMWFLICNFCQKAVSFLVIPIFTRIMPSEEYGVYTLYVSWHDILLVFTSLCIYYGAFNNFLIKFPDDRKKVISSLQGLTTVLTISVFGIYLLGKQFFYNVSGLPFHIMVAMFMDLLLYPPFAFWMAKERFDYKYKNIVLVTIGISLMSQILGLLLVSRTIYKVEARIYSIVFVNVVVSSIVFLRAFCQGKKFYSKRYWSYALKFNLPLIPHYLSGMILIQADRIMINFFCGSQKSAVYGVAYSAAMIVSVATNAINATLTPWTYKCLKKGEEKQLKQMTNRNLMFIFFMIAVVNVMGPEILMVLGGEEYYEAIWAFPFISGSILFIYIYSRFVDVEFFYEKSNYALIVSVVSAVINMILNWIFISRYGFSVAGVTTLFSYVIGSFLHYVFSLKLLKKIGKTLPYQIKFIFVISLCMLIFCLFSCLLYLLTWLRYLFGIFCILAALIYLFCIRSKVTK